MMSSLKIIFITFLFALAPNVSFTQTEYFDTTQYNTEELKEDFNLFRKKLETKAPLLYLYNSKGRTNFYLDSLYESIDHAMTPIEFFRLLAPINGFLKDQHTSIFPGTEMFNSVSEFPNLIPVDIELFGDQSLITFNFSSSTQLEQGTEIVSINDVPCDEIMKTLHSIYNRDGYDMELPKQGINVDFWFYYHLLYGISPTYKFEFISGNGETRNCTVPGATMDKMDAILALTPKTKNEDREPGIYLEVIDSLKTGILSIEDYSSSTFKENQGKRYKQLVAEHFSTIEEKELSTLIIDVRGNRGGHPNNVKHTLKFLLDSPFELITELRQVKKPNEESFDKRTKKRWYPTLGIGTFKPHKNNFKGKVIVLMNGESLSATAELVSVLKRYNRAIFIGTMSGGNPIVLSGSLNKGYWELPNTKLKAFVPNKCQILGNIELNTGFGLEPDYLIEHNINDILTNSDRTLLYAIGLINSK